MEGAKFEGELVDELRRRDERRAELLGRVLEMGRGDALHPARARRTDQRGEGGVVEIHDGGDGGSVLLRGVWMVVDECGAAGREDGGHKE